MDKEIEKFQLLVTLVQP